MCRATLHAVFGLSFPELCVLLIVAMVVLGPKELPRYLRKAGQMASRLRRLAIEMREKSGIDEVLRTEGLDREIAEFRRLARGEILGVSLAMRAVANATRIDPPIASPYVPTPPPDPAYATVAATSSVQRETNEREYPREGADSYGAMSDTSTVYEDLRVPTPLAEDALYMRGEAPPEGAAAPAAMSAVSPDASSTAPTGA
jgi:sec-independent protein translocase protein TatB